MGGQRHAPAALPPGKRPGTHCVGDWVGLRAGLDRCEKSLPHSEFDLGQSSPYRVAIPTELSQSSRNINPSEFVGLLNQFHVSKLNYETYIFNFGLYYPYNTYLSEEGCENPLLFFEAERGRRARNVWVTLP